MLSPDAIPFQLACLVAVLLWLIVWRTNGRPRDEWTDACLHLSRLDRLDGLTCSECDL